MRILELLYEIGWLISAVLFYGLCLLPCWYVIIEAQSVGMPFRIFFYSLSPFLFIIALIILSGLVKQLFIPKLKEGKYPFPESGQAFVWFANRWVTDLLLVPFNRIIYLNDLLRYATLRLFGADISYSTAISSPNITDFDLVKIGKHTTIGAWTKIYPHLQPGSGKLILAPVTIGSNSFIGADCGLMCGTHIGDHVFVAYNTTFGIYCSIGNNTTIGWFCTIGRRCNIGDNVTIGSHCHIGSNVTIRPGVTLPDHCRISDNQIIEASMQDKLKDKLS